MPYTLKFSGPEVDGRLEMAGVVRSPNLLHNGDFRNPVNQRGVSGTRSTVGYFIDLWTLEQGTIEMVANTGIKLIHYTKQAVINQNLENKLDTTAVHTISAKIDGAIYSISFTPDTTPTWRPLTTAIGVRMSNNGSLGLVSFANSDSINDHTISLVKVELGSVSTLANDTPADYGVELSKCQRYYQLLKFSRWAGIGIAMPYSNVNANLIIPCQPFRLTPSIDSNYTTGLNYLSGGITGLTVGAYINNSSEISLALVGSFTINTPTWIAENTGSNTVQIGLSADL